jgi:hypothetical protein
MIHCLDSQKKNGKAIQQQEYFSSDGFTRAACNNYIEGI